MGDFNPSSWQCTETSLFINYVTHLTNFDHSPTPSYCLFEGFTLGLLLRITPKPTPLPPLTALRNIWMAPYILATGKGDSVFAACCHLRTSHEHLPFAALFFLFQKVVDHSADMCRHLLTQRWRLKGRKLNRRMGWCVEHLNYPAIRHGTRL